MKTNKQGLPYHPGHVARLTGQRFGALVVTGRSGNSGNFAAWLCRCDCGAEVVMASEPMRRGLTKSCGCLRKQTFINNLHEGRRRAIERAKLAAKTRPPSEKESGVTLSTPMMHGSDRSSEKVGAAGSMAAGVSAAR